MSKWIAPPLSLPLTSGSRNATLGSLRCPSAMICGMCTTVYIKTANAER